MDCILQRDNFEQLESGDVKAGRWTSEEHSLFLQGLQMYNKQWKQIAELVKTRTVVQIRTHAQKYFQKLDKMKDGKMPKPATSLLLLESKDDQRKASSRSSSITSEGSLDTDADTDIEEFRWDSIPGNADTPRKRPREKSLSGAPKQFRANKRPNIGGNTLSISTETNFDLFTLPSDEGPALDQSIVTLLEKIDWSGPYSRCPSPFMDSAASVCSSLDTLQDTFPFFDFGCNTELSTPRTVSVSDNLAVYPIALGKERLAFSNVVKEMKQVFSSYKIGCYDRLPSIKTLLSMRSSSISVSCTSNLTPSHSTFCHYQLSESPNLFNDSDFQPIGISNDQLGSEAHLYDKEDAMDLDDNDLLSPTPRKRGRPRKNSI